MMNNSFNPSFMKNPVGLVSFSTFLQVVCSCVVISVNAQTNFSGVIAVGSPRGLDTCADGGYVVAHQYGYLKLDAAFNIEWTKIFLNGEISGIAAKKSGGFGLVTTSQENPDECASFFYLDNQGEIVNTIDECTSEWSYFPHNVVTSFNDGLLFAVYYDGYHGENDVFYFEYDNDFNYIRRFNILEDGNINDFKASSDHSYFSISANDCCTPTYSAFQKHSASGGNLVRTDIGNYEPDETDYEFSAIAQSTDGGYLASGYSQPYNGLKSTLFWKLNENGDSLWVKKYENQYFGTISDIFGCPDGSYIVTINKQDKSNILQLDENANIIWSAYLDAKLMKIIQGRNEDLIILGNHKDASTLDHIYLTKTSCNNIKSVNIIKPIPVENNYKLVSNPAKLECVILAELNVGDDWVELFDMTGRMVKKGQFKNSEYRSGPIDAGTYLVLIHSPLGLVTKKVIIQD